MAVFPTCLQNCRRTPCYVNVGPTFGLHMRINGTPCPIHIIRNFGVADGAILWPPDPDFHLHPNIRDTVGHFHLARDTAANTCDKNRCYIDLCSMVRPLTSTICTLFFFLAFFCIRKSIRTSVLPSCETICKDGKAFLEKQVAENNL